MEFASTPKCLNGRAEAGVRLRSRDSLHDSVGAEIVGAHRHDPRSPNVFLRPVPIRYERLKALVDFGQKREADPSHASDSHDLNQWGIPSGTRLSRAIHWSLSAGVLRGGAQPLETRVASPKNADGSNRENSANSSILTPFCRTPIGWRNRLRGPTFPNSVIERGLERRFSDYVGHLPKSLGTPQREE
jgi:hypothetical protein